MLIVSFNDEPSSLDLQFARTSRCSWCLPPGSDTLHDFWRGRHFWRFRILFTSISALYGRDTEKEAAGHRDRRGVRLLGLAESHSWRVNFVKAYSTTETRTRVARVRAEYLNQLEYSGYVILCLFLQTLAPGACCLLPAACFLLHIACCLSPAACCPVFSVRQW